MVAVGGADLDGWKSVFLAVQLFRMDGACNNRAGKGGERIGGRGRGEREWSGCVDGGEGGVGFGGRWADEMGLLQP
jgi:hypothetical protein